MMKEVPLGELHKSICSIEFTETLLKSRREVSLLPFTKNAELKKKTQQSMTEPINHGLDLTLKQK